MRTGAGRRTASTPLTARSSFWWGLFAAIVIVGAGGAIAAISLVTPSNLKATPSYPAMTPAPERTPSLDRTALSIDDPMSLWLVVDKLRPLNPISWVPPDLVSIDVPKNYVAYMRAPAAAQLKRMFDDYSNLNPGRSLMALSSYRSYDMQKSIWDGNYTLTALPGHSEHQTGMAVDVGSTSGKCPIQICFGDEPEGKWVAANAHKYGFIIRYPLGKEGITGYQYEPWHLRFVGPVLAWYMHDTQTQTLEQAFNLPAAPKYANQP